MSAGVHSVSASAFTAVSSSNCDWLPGEITSVLRAPYHRLLGSEITAGWAEAPSSSS